MLEKNEVKKKSGSIFLMSVHLHSFGILLQSTGLVRLLLDRKGRWQFFDNCALGFFWIYRVPQPEKLAQSGVLGIYNFIIDSQLKRT